MNHTSNFHRNVAYTEMVQLSYKQLDFARPCCDCLTMSIHAYNTHVCATVLCMCSCVCEREGECLCACECVCMHTCVYPVCVRVYVHAYVHACVCVCVCGKIPNLQVGDCYKMLSLASHSDIIK